MRHSFCFQDQGQDFCVKTKSKHTQNMLVYSIHVSQSSVAMRLKCVGFQWQFYL